MHSLFFTNSPRRVRKMFFTEFFFSRFCRTHFGRREHGERERGEWECARVLSIFHKMHFVRAFDVHMPASAPAHQIASVSSISRISSINFFLCRCCHLSLQRITAAMKDAVAVCVEHILGSHTHTRRPI